jgi:hypothetical protein
MYLAKTRSVLLFPLISLPVHGEGGVGNRPSPRPLATPLPLNAGEGGRDCATAQCCLNRRLTRLHRLLERYCSRGIGASCLTSLIRPGRFLKPARSSSPPAGPRAEPRGQAIQTHSPASRQPPVFLAQLSWPPSPGLQKKTKKNFFSHFFSIP